MISHMQVSSLHHETNQILRYVVLSRIDQIFNISITASCSREVPGAVGIKGHVETQDPSTSERVFRSLDEWRRTGPVVFINNSWATLDHNCALLAPDNTSQDECIKIKISTPTVKLLPYNIIYVLVGVFCSLGLLVFLTCIVILIIVISCYCRRYRNEKTTRSVAPM